MKNLFILFFALVSLALGDTKPTPKPKLTDLGNQVDDELRKTKIAEREEAKSSSEKMIQKQKADAARQMVMPPGMQTEQQACQDNPGACRFGGNPNMKGVQPSPLFNPAISNTPFQKSIGGSIPLKK
mgnify:CR=1 FL=1